MVKVRELLGGELLRYDEIFRDMVNTIVNDYAGYEEKKSLHDFMHFSLACQDMEEQGQMNDLVFMRMMNEYLVTFAGSQSAVSLEGQQGISGLHQWF